MRKQLSLPRTFLNEMLLPVILFEVMFAYSTKKKIGKH